MKIWREAYETLGRETKEEEDDFDREHKERIIKETKEIDRRERKKKQNVSNILCWWSKGIVCSAIKKSRLIA